MSMNKYIAVIGGDKRQFYMCKLLTQKGFNVISLGVELDEDKIENITIADSLEQIMDMCNMIIGPIPFTRDGIHIFSNIDLKIRLEEFVSLIQANHIILGGNINSLVINAVNNQNANYFDFMKDNFIASKNAIATAEGTILEAIKSSDINLYDSKCLVLGYGRCAKVLAETLKALKADVTIAARNKEQRELADTNGLKAISLEEAPTKLSNFDFIFNSIPAMVISSVWLLECKPEVVIIDIASKPGGTDFEECKRLGIKALLALGLPGKYAPKTSAEILIESIGHYLPD